MTKTEKFEFEVISAKEMVAVCACVCVCMHIPSMSVFMIQSHSVGFKRASQMKKRKKCRLLCVKRFELHFMYLRPQCVRKCNLKFRVHVNL